MTEHSVDMSLSYLIQALIEEKFYQECENQLGLNRAMVDSRLREMLKATTIQEEEESGAEEIYDVFNKLINTISIKMEVDKKSWAGIEMKHV